MAPSTLRILRIIFILVIITCCTIAAILSLKAGHRPKALGTFAAGVAFSFLIGRGLRRKQ